jgi:PAS domain S-box-containing protein
MNDSQTSLSQQLLYLKKTTSWSWETMCRQFHQVMGKAGPSNTTLFRYASKKVKRPNPVVEKYVQDAIHKIEIESVQQGLAESERHRKRAEHELRGVESRFRSLVENAQDVVYRYRLLPSRRYEYVSPAVTNFTGYTPEEYYADPDLDLKIIHPADRQSYEETAAGNHRFHQPVVRRYRHKDGRWVWTERVHVPVFDEENNVVAFEGISRDITERKQAEKDQAYLIAIVESSEDAIIGVSPDGTIMSWNPAARKLLGYASEEAIGQCISLIHPKEDPQRFDRIQGKLSKDEAVDNPDTVVISKSGERIKVSIKSSTIKDRQGKVLGFSGMIREIRKSRRNS